MDSLYELQQMADALNAIWFDEDSFYGQYVFLDSRTGEVYCRTLDDAIVAYLKYSEETSNDPAFYDIADDWDAAAFEADKALALKF